MKYILIENLNTLYINKIKVTSYSKRYNYSSLKMFYKCVFVSKGIFNFDLLDFLYKNQSIYKSRYKLFMKLLCDESEISFKFINEYIAQREDKKIS